MTNHGGCALALTCDACPLPACLVELRGSLRDAPALARMIAITRRYRAGEHPRALAVEYGVSRIQVYRAAARVRQLGVTLK